MSWIADLIQTGDRLFGKREPLLALWQDICENFDPVGADFTASHYLGKDFAGNLMTSYPLIVARELTDAFSTMLRPTEKEWAKMEVEGLEDYEGKRWLEWATRLQRRAMYDKAAGFVVAAKQVDKRFAIVGQGVGTVKVWNGALLYQSWHLRDTVWCEGVGGQVEAVHRKWKPEANILKRFYGENKLHQKVRDQLQPGKDPYCEINCRHIVIPTDMYGGPEKFRTPLVELMIDVDNEHVMEVTGQRVNPYVIPRWQRIEGSQYACSAATICALPEARLLQAMTFTLLEAGEKYVSPPLLATEEMIRGDIDVRASGITWVSAEYDERMGEVLRPLNQDKSGMPLGLELQTRSETMLRVAMFLDKLNLPVDGPEMTAYETAQRVQEYIRHNLPLFEPAEVESNGGWCERTFDVLATNGAFGHPDTWPRSLQGQDIEFKFTSPIRDAANKQKGRIFLDGLQIIGAAVAIDPAAAAVADIPTAERDALEGIEWPMDWTRSKEAVEAIQEKHAQDMKQQALLDSMGKAAAVVKDLGGVQAGQAA